MAKVLQNLFQIKFEIKFEIPTALSKYNMIFEELIYQTFFWKM